MNTNRAGRIYHGWIRHRRFEPVSHAFNMPIAMLCINIDEWPRLFDGVPWWSSRRFNVGWLREADYLSHIHGTRLRDRLAHLLQESGRQLEGPVYLLTHPRYFGFGMNPISCYYCYQADGRTLDCMVAEVTNTPWQQRMAYVIPCQAERRQQHARFAKQLFVSPFNPMAMDYDIRFNAPADKLYVQLENRDALDQRITDATLVLREATWSRPALLNLLWQFPLMTLQVGAGIYWQALKLWWKGAPAFLAQRPRNPSFNHALKEYRS